MANLLLFGPPGVGKSTIISEIESEERHPRYGTCLYVVGADLERIRTKKGISLEQLRLEEAMALGITFTNACMTIRNAWPKQIRLVVGAAALDPKLEYPGFKKVLLTMPQAEYEARRKIRDKQFPQKGLQSKHNIDDWRKGVHYDYVLDVSGPLDHTVYEVINLALSLKHA